MKNNSDTCKFTLQDMYIVKHMGLGGLDEGSDTCMRMSLQFQVRRDICKYVSAMAIMACVNVAVPALAWVYVMT